MRTRIAAAAMAALVVPGFTLLVQGSADAAGAYYSSCDQLTQHFKHGVAKSKSAAKKQVRQGYGMPAYGTKARAVYWTNHARLDRDDDGTACEG